MTDREKITAILKAYTKKHNISASSVILEEYAEELLANGVIVPPVEVGRTVWVISQWYKYTKPEIESRKVLSVQIYKNRDIQYHYKDGCFWQGHLGTTVFLTKEEAEAKLKEREG